ncbi:MAG: DUF4411 family protein [Acidithiobacillus ferriphilus]|uniref:DUF4411 family protein n=1 Tax=Acidithiobacillus ferriphilus TaxID=1689834 RepID=UPI001C077E23|nr:DUF4411 family protein [Acidithiobacillus ferriphilus]MBU2827449.1 DUF4411 family protein [Acidithiobacillus ferriphilus]MBU2846268.1 DUF4411 family protein [Acidithiobacillus ferriphilus]
MPTRYLLDANTFIEAKRRYYAFDICPGFWNALLANHDGRRLWSIDQVRDELLRGGADELTQWVDARVPGSLFLPTADGTVIQNFALMMTWVQNQPQFIPAAKAEFASVADGWLAAYAKARGYTVITHEVARPDARKRVPLPNVCDAFGVPYNDTFNMLRDFGSRFI